MKSTLLAVSLSIPALVICILASVAYGQPANYSQYSGNFVDMNIEYPKNWIYSELNGNIFSNDDYATIFVPPSEVKFLSNMTAKRADVAAQNVTVQIAKQRDLPYKNMPLDLYLDYVQKLQKSLGNNVSNATKINLTDGTPAYEYGVLYPDDNKKGYVVIMNKSPESYYFSYLATPEKFNTYLPIAKQMLKSLSFNK